MAVKNQLALSLRPKRFSELIGQEKITNKIKNLVAKRIPKAYLFHGSTGTGKTTTARILAVSLQCKDKEFGEPCDKCYRRFRRKEFPIVEINCASIIEQSQKQRMSAAQAIREKLSSSAYELLGRGKFRVFIFDEAHNLSGEAQDACLSYFEDSPVENIFIICSTRPEKIVKTLRRRCAMMHVRTLNPDNIKKLVRKGLKVAKSDLSSTVLTDALVERKVNSPGLILNAVENYIAGDTPEDAAEVEGASEISAKSLCKHVTKGDWPGIAKMLRDADASEARRLRAYTVVALHGMLSDCTELDDRTKALYEAIQTLSRSAWTEDINQIPLLAAELASLCATFKNYSF